MNPLFFLLANAPIFVSLGSHCEPAVHIQENHLRNAAYPFDWLMTLDHDRFCRVLDEDFLYFLDESHLVPHPLYPHVLENHYYEIEFRHDWPFSDYAVDPDRKKQQMEEMRSKYGRRINRFRQLRDSGRKVFFLRSAYDFENDPNVFWIKETHAKVTRDEIHEIKQTLCRFFPDLNFTLVSVNYSDEYKIETTDDGIELEIRKGHKLEDYKNAFLFLNLSAIED